jgi:response regulator RpfG family c-di-GMP phosphodiesterase
MEIQTQQPSVAPGRPATILLVDDEDDLRAAIRRSLRDPQLKIVESTNGREALDRIAAGGVDVVISDFNMPGMNGLDLLQRVRLTSPEVVRIMLTGMSDIRVAIRALNEGSVHRLLLKPWSQIDLRGIVRIALATHRAF